MRTNKLFMLLATLLIVSCSSEELLNTDFSQESITQLQKEQKKVTEVNAVESNDEDDALEKNDNCDTKPSDISKFKDALAFCKYEKTGSSDRNATGYCSNGSFNSYNTSWMVFQSSGSKDHRSEVKVYESFSIDDEQKMSLDMIIEYAPFDDRGTSSDSDDRGLTVAQIHNRGKSGGRPLLRIAAVGDELRYIIAKKNDGGGTITESIMDFSSSNKHFYIELKFTGDGKTFTIYVKSRKTGDVFSKSFSVDGGSDWDWDGVEDDYYFKTGAYAQVSSGSNNKPRVSLSVFKLDLNYDGSSSSSSSTDSSTSSSSNIVRMRKRNAMGYALDGGNGGSNGQNVKIWSYNSSNNNQKWIEINRGGGYYSYQKMNTNYCLDASNGGSNGNNVKLWSCSSSNQNQQFKKVNMGSGYYRLQKRNASNYSVDGNNGGGNNQNVHMWRNSNSNHNQHWKIE